MQQGRIDAAFIIAAESAPVVQVLLRSPGVKVMSFSQADAYQRRFPFLTKLTLPQGVADLVRDYPPQDVTLLAPTANVIVRDDLHPALQTLAAAGDDRGPWQVRLLQQAPASSRPTRTGWCRSRRRRHVTSSPARLSCSVTSRSGWRFWSIA